MKFTEEFEEALAVQLFLKYDNKASVPWNYIKQEERDKYLQDAKELLEKTSRCIV